VAAEATSRRSSSAASPAAGCGSPSAGAGAAASPAAGASAALSSGMPGSVAASSPGAVPSAGAGAVLLAAGASVAVLPGAWVSGGLASASSGAGSLPGAGGARCPVLICGARPGGGGLPGGRGGGAAGAFSGGPGGVAAGFEGGQSPAGGGAGCGGQRGPDACCGGAGRAAGGRGGSGGRGRVRVVSLRGVLLSCGHWRDSFSGVSRPGLFRVIAEDFSCGLSDHHSGWRSRQAVCVVISVTWTAEPSYLAEHPADKFTQAARFGISGCGRQDSRGGASIPHAQLAVAWLRSGVRRRRGCGPSAGRPRPHGASARRCTHPRRALARGHVRPGQPHPASRGRASPGTRRYTHLAGRAPGRTSACEQACKRAAGHINNRYQPHMITAPATPTIVLQAWTCISLGVHRKVQIGRYRGIIGRPGIPVSAGIQNGIRISWREGTPAGSRVIPGLVTAPGRDTAGAWQ